MRFSRRLPLFVAACLLALAGPARAEVLIQIDKLNQQMSVTVDGDLRYLWPVSTGRKAYDTPAGEFQGLSMARHHFSREWDDAPMPYSIFFTRAGHAIHGSYEVRRLGAPASHGCVRLAPQNAALLFALVKEQGVKNAHVVLTGELPSGTALAARKGTVLADEATTRPRKTRAARYDFFDHPYYNRRHYYGSPFSALFGRW